MQRKWPFSLTSPLASLYYVNGKVLHSLTLGPMYVPKPLLIFDLVYRGKFNCSNEKSVDFSFEIHGTKKIQFIRIRNSTEKSTDFST